LAAVILVAWGNERVRRESRNALRVPRISVIVVAARWLGYGVMGEWRELSSYNAEQIAARPGLTIKPKHPDAAGLGA
jgi:hypothetical protein